MRTHFGFDTRKLSLSIIASLILNGELAILVLVGTNKRVELTTPFKFSSTEDFTLIFSRSDSDGSPHRAGGLISNDRYQSRDRSQHQ